MKNIVITLFGLAILFSCTKENQLSTPPKDNILSEHEMAFVNPDSIMNAGDIERARPCPYAAGMSVLTYGQNLVVPDLYSIIIGGSAVNVPLNAVIDMSYRVSTDLRNWSQPTLVYCRTVTPADTGLSTMVGFSHQILGDVRLVHALRKR